VQTLETRPATDPAPASAIQNTRFPPRIAATPAHRARRLLADTERFWLAPTALPLARRMADTGWTPDFPGSFCDRCGRSVGPHDASEFGCSSCRPLRLPWLRFVRLGAHRDPLRQWIHEVKFTRWRRLGLDLGVLLGQRIAEAGPPGRGLCVVPVAMSWRRRLARGVDHAAIIAQGVALALNVPLLHALRRRHGPSQLAVAAGERHRNVARAFRCSKTAELQGRTVILVDDVRTTGATLMSAARALHGGRIPRDPDRAALGGVSVWAASLAAAETGVILGRKRGLAAGGEAGRIEKVSLA
jgi:ComF family protein